MCVFRVIEREETLSGLVGERKRAVRPDQLRRRLPLRSWRQDQCQLRTGVISRRLGVALPGVKRRPFAAAAYTPAR